ncbi:ABC transporter ATP-binding protein [Desulfogranum japonicum]|uniref:ABC transporter ATP-binding protein n=1 Tax=Desulfogranum japonicum TaxID=231447 RepID=UPI000414D9F8|nr:ABC transporter ATP-binding protein [Desulfogranum japonicum]
MSTQTPRIRLENISKNFGKVQANADINLEIHSGQILALLGENGAGKSTLMSILAGQLQPDSGTIYLDGDPVAFTGTDRAIKSGIGMVYQHFKLVEAMTVAENVFLGIPDTLFIRKKAMNREVRELVEQYGMSVDPDAVVHDLSMGEKQQVEILKLLYRNSSILIFDEPTAVLTPTEAERLFATMQQMIGLGKAVVFISHKLEEVLAVADYIAILKRGRVVDSMPRSAVSGAAELARRMVGRTVLLEVDKEPVELRQTVLKVAQLNGMGLEDVSFELQQGEVLGLVGVAGNGQRALVETICGLRIPEQGAVRILGQDWRKFYSRNNWEQSLSYIPEDRLGLATCRGLDLVDNFLLTTRGGFCRGPWIQRQQAKFKVESLIEKFDIRPPDAHALAWQLSGGNLQKMVLAREFYRRPHLIVAEQPTQGLDIAAAEDVWRLLMHAREQAGVLLVTGDLGEALALSDRIGVMFAGKILGIVDAGDAEQVAKIPEMMAGMSVDI